MYDICPFKVSWHNASIYWFWYMKNTHPMGMGTLFIPTLDPDLFSKFSMTLYSVVGAPKPKRGANVFRVVGFLGMPINLIMNSQGYPYPTYTWSHNGRVLPSNMHVDLDWVSLLNLTRLKVEDFGKYSLKMTNNIGTYTADYELVASGKFI